MKKEKYYPPKFCELKFHCPHCGVYSKQHWAHFLAQHIHNFGPYTSLSHFSQNLSHDWNISKCEHCSNYVIWYKGKIIYPKTVPVEMPNEDLNTDIREDYIEAANVFSESPRASGALIRLALQKLMIQLG
ncbi:DUF4145 domain-containing protein, partial [bacterium]|nr:DUF4145 domain-containing protein [bacterium]